MKIVKSSCSNKRKVRTCTFSPQVNIKNKRTAIQTEQDVNAAHSEAKIQDLIDDIRSNIYTKVKAVATSSDFGFDENEIDDYFFVEASAAEIGEDHHEAIRVEVRAEVSYEGLEDLMEALNPIIETYDSYAYFEPVEPGIIEAYVSVNQVDMSIYGATASPDHMFYDYHGKRFSVHDNSSEIGEDNIDDVYFLWKGNISQQAGAYNDADEDYVYAFIRGRGVIEYYKKGKYVATDNYTLRDEDDFEYAWEYMEIILQHICDRLIAYNKDVPDRMVYNSTDIESSSVHSSGDLSMYSKQFHDAYTSAYIDFKELYPQIEVSEIYDDPSSDDNEICIEICDTNSGDCGKLYLNTQDEFVDSDYILRSFEETAEAIGLLEDNTVYSSIESSDSYEYDGANYEFVTNIDGYWVYRAVVDGKGTWRAMPQGSDESEFSRLSFPISYDQARGFEPINEPSAITKLRKDLGKKLLPKSGQSIEATEDLTDLPENFQHAYTLAKNDFMNDYISSGVEVYVAPDDFNAEDGEICLIVKGINRVGKPIQGKVYVDIDQDADEIYQALDETAESIGMIDDDIKSSSAVNAGAYMQDDSIVIDAEDLKGYSKDEIKKILDDAPVGSEIIHIRSLSNRFNLDSYIEKKESYKSNYNQGFSSPNDWKTFNTYWTVEGTEDPYIVRMIYEAVNGKNKYYGLTSDVLKAHGLDAVESDTEYDEDDRRAEDDPWIQNIDWAMSQLPPWFKIQGDNLEYNVSYEGQTAHVSFFLFDGAKYTYTIDGEGPYSTNQIEQINFDLQDYFDGLPITSAMVEKVPKSVMSSKESDVRLGDTVEYNGDLYVIIDDESDFLTLRPLDRFVPEDFDDPDGGDCSEDVFLDRWQLDKSNRRYVKLSEEDKDSLPMVDQEYDSAATSINSSKLPAIYKMINLEPGGLYVDFGGGRWDNAVEYIKDKGATLVVYDPYNRSAEHNKEVLRILRENGGADAAINSNVLNVIKEPEARKNVLENIARITKPGAPIYITVYEGKGDGQEGPTKSGYQLNRKTADYLEEIQEVFPDATRKGKLITAHNSNVSAATNVSNIGAKVTCSDEYNSEWIKVAQKEVPDSDGFYTDYTMYVSEDGSTYIFMFGDSDVYGPDIDYADHECSNWDEAVEWWNSYDGFEDENLKDVYSSDSIGNHMIITVNSGISGDGFSITVEDEQGDVVFNEAYRFGVNTSYDRKYAERAEEDYQNAKKYGWSRIPELKPYVGDIIDDICNEYNIQKNDIVFKRGNNVFKGSEVTDSVVNDFIDSYINASYSIKGSFSDLEDEYLSPPEYDDPIEHEASEELIEVEINQVITVDVDGDYEWDDDTYIWASPDGSNEEWRSEDGVYVDDKVGVVEHIDDLIIPNVPTRPGKYRVTGLAELIYDVSGIQEYRTEYGPDDYDSDIDIDHAVVSFNFRKSEVQNLKITPVRR